MKAFSIYALLCASLVLVAASFAVAGKQNIGTPMTGQEIAPWNIDIRSDGTGLPIGQGTVLQGQEIFSSRCVMCHGEQGIGTELAPALKGGIGSLATKSPKKTVGSFWPYPTMIFDYVRRAMPLNDPGSLSTDEVYALTAYVLYINGIVPQDISVTRSNLPLIEMPNRFGFKPDDRITREKKFWNRAPCMRNCSPIVPE